MPRKATQHRLELRTEPRKARIIIHGSLEALGGCFKAVFGLPNASERLKTGEDGPPLGSLRFFCAPQALRAFEGAKRRARRQLEITKPLTAQVLHSGT